MQLKCVVVDDEPLALEMMSAYVKKTPSLALAGAFSNSVEALDFLRNHSVQVAFVDIQMPDINGLELGGLLSGRETRLVYVTAYEQYALEGFKVEALDYLLKPVSYNDFLRAAQRAQRWFERGNENVAVMADKTGNGDADGLIRSDAGGMDSFFVRSDYRWVHVRMEDILYVESDKDYVKIYLDPKGKSRQDTPGSSFCIMTLQCMKALEEKLSGKQFLRIHRSYLVNVARVASVERNKVIFADGQSVPVSDSYKPALDEYIAKRNL